MDDFTNEDSFCILKGYPRTNTASVNDVTLAASHEFIEAYVDPKGNGAEIGDPCDCSAKVMNGRAWMTFQGATRPWFVQQPWLPAVGGFGGPPTPAGCGDFSDPLPSAINSSGFAVARTPNNLDEFYSTAAGTLTSSFWSSGNNWNHTTAAAGSKIEQNSLIAATARTPNNLDVFFIGSDGAVWTSAWRSGGSWGTRAISAANLAPPGASIAAVTRAANSLDVFFVDNGGNLDRLAWSGSTWALSSAGAGAIQPGAGVAAVARTTQNLDVFFIGTDGALYNTFLQPGMTSFGRFRVPITKPAVSGSSVAATSRAWSNLDVYVIDQSGGLDFYAWNTDTQWRFGSTGISAPPDSGLAALSRDPNKRDVFFVDSNGVEHVFWNGSWNHETAQSNPFVLNVFVPGEQIAAVTRIPTYLDVFEMGEFLGAIPAPMTEFWSQGHPWGASGN
jgi:hypothetical protein